MIKLIPYCIGVNEIGQSVYITHYLFENSFTTRPLTQKKIFKGVVKTPYYKTQNK